MTWHQQLTSRENLGFSVGCAMLFGSWMGSSQAPSGGGDSKIPSNDGIALSVATQAQMQPYIDKAKEIDPQAAAAVELAIHDGHIGVARLYDDNAYGVSDWNTIGIRRDVNVLVGAVALLHEYQHVLGCGGGPPNGGSETHGSGRDPCYKCVHRDLQAVSHQQLLDRICAIVDENERAAVCVIALRAAAAGKVYEAECSITPNCSYPPLHNWNQPCPTCDE